MPKKFQKFIHYFFTLIKIDSSHNKSTINKLIYIKTDTKGKKKLKLLLLLLLFEKISSLASLKF